MACLFLLPANGERYGPLKPQLDNKFLMGEHKYPSNVLVAKRLMPNVILATGTVKHTHQESSPLDVAFVETNTNLRPTCYCCEEQHPGGYKKCPKVKEGL